MSPSPFPLPSFIARVVKGAGRGRTIGAPTLNLSLDDIPHTLKSGIYACRVAWNRRTFAAAMHFGPRPVFKDSITCEVHIINHSIRRAPLRVRVEIVKRLRGIRNFRTVGLLQKQIEKDLRQARTILFQ
ncbi:MAG: riboflavin kinase [Candidatus Peribacteraceae bacterium]|nr:riboflavin kinase [Candidatus Peribacteraceae bacterium]MDD5739419.1 riboflavin kinase [Candidatus Peribacteraceae bacterium]